MNANEILEISCVPVELKPFRISQPVLIIEDQLSQSRIAEAMLHDKWECEVYVANSYKQAQEVLESKGSELVAAICDLNLPDAPYGEVIDLVNEHGVPSIALTGTFGGELRSMILKKGVLDYVLKEGVNSYEYVAQLVGRLYKNKSTKVLVADDSLSSRAMLKHMLGAQCLEVITANDGHEALEVLADNPDIRLVLVDYNMPRIDGFGFVLEARKKIGKDRLAIIGISAEDNDEVSARFLKNGANDFIAKPYSYEELICRVTQNLEMLDMVDSIRDTANRDYLTGLYNRRFFFTEGRNAFKRATRSRQELCVVMMDVDYFKKINDEHGHDCGDAVLQYLSAMLGTHFQNSLVARIGGEEFAALMVGEDMASVRERLEALRLQVENSGVPYYEDGEVKFTISMGATNAMLDNLDEMLKKADENLYVAKQAGRNRLVG